MTHMPAALNRSMQGGAVASALVAALPQANVTGVAGTAAAPAATPPAIPPPPPPMPTPSPPQAPAPRQLQPLPGPPPLGPPAAVVISPPPPGAAVVIATSTGDGTGLPTPAIVAIGAPGGLLDADLHPLFCVMFSIPGFPPVCIGL